MTGGPVRGPVGVGKKVGDGVDRGPVGVGEEVGDGADWGLFDVGFDGSGDVEAEGE